MEPVPISQPPPLLHNRYRATARLGTTRLAVVYRASDERLRRSVLVHLLRPELREQESLRQRFLDETQHRARRTHPALLEVYDSGEVDNLPFVVTEDVSGRPLKEALPLLPDQALRVWRQIVGAALTCQEAGSPPPPITSSSIIFTDEGRPELVEPWWMSQEELLLAVAHYRAPERTQGLPPVQSTPVYSLGILGYELFGGALPFTGNTPQEAAQQHLTQRLPPASTLISGFAPRLSQILEWSTVRDPNNRLPDLATLARELAAVESAAEVPTQPLVRPVRPLRETVRESLRPVTGAMRPHQQSAVAPPVAPVRELPPPPPSPRPTPQPSEAELKKQMRKEVRREVRRQGCRRWIARRVVGLAFLLALLGGCAWGANYGLNWFRAGGAQAACAQSLPGFLCGLLPAPGESYIVRSDLNLRSQPEVNPSTVITTLRAGSRVRARGEPQVANGVTWLPVSASVDGKTVDGWVSLDYLQKEQ